MEIIKKLVQLGDSKGVIIPKIWLDSVERVMGKNLTEIVMVIDGNIVIKPRETQ